MGKLNALASGIAGARTPKRKGVGDGFAFGVLFALGLMFTAFGFGFERTVPALGGLVLVVLAFVGVWHSATREDD